MPILLAIILALALCILKKRRQLRDDEEVLVKDEDDKQQQEKSKRRFHPYNWVIPILKKSRIGLKRDVSPSQEYKVPFFCQISTKRYTEALFFLNFQLNK